MKKKKKKLDPEEEKRIQKEKVSIFLLCYNIIINCLLSY